MPQGAADSRYVRCYAAFTPIRIGAAMQDLCCNEINLVRRVAAAQPHVMWFIGAGASRTAGMPTATDIIWDLKRRYYYLHENQDLAAHNVNNQTVRDKIQRYMASKGFPPAGSADEYAFYFALTLATIWPSSGAISPTSCGPIESL